MQVEKIPDWLRYLLIPVGVVVSFIAVNLFFYSIWMTQDLLFGIGKNLYRLIIENIVQASASSLLAVFAGTKICPEKHRMKITISLGAIFVIPSFLSLALGFFSSQVWKLVNLGAVILGSMIGVYAAFDEHRKSSARNLGQ